MRVDYSERILTLNKVDNVAGSRREIPAAYSNAWIWGRVWPDLKDLRGAGLAWILERCWPCVDLLGMLAGSESVRIYGLLMPVRIFGLSEVYTYFRIFVQSAQYPYIRIRPVTM